MQSACDKGQRTVAANSAVVATHASAADASALYDIYACAVDWVKEAASNEAASYGAAHEEVALTIDTERIH